MKLFSPTAPPTLHQHVRDSIDMINGTEFKLAELTKDRNDPSSLCSAHNLYYDAPGQASSLHIACTIWASHPCRKQIHPLYRKAPTLVSPGRCRNLQQCPRSPGSWMRQYYIRHRQCHSCPSWPGFPPYLSFVLVMLLVREEHRVVRRW